LALLFMRSLISVWLSCPQQLCVVLFDTMSPLRDQLSSALPLTADRMILSSILGSRERKEDNLPRAACKSPVGRDAVLCRRTQVQMFTRGPGPPHSDMLHLSRFRPDLLTRKSRDTPLKSILINLPSTQFWNGRPPFIALIHSDCFTNC
jgi:hypothetical protein